MKINSIKISYSTTIPIMSYGVNDKIGVEIEHSVDDYDFKVTSPQDFIEETTKSLKENVDAIVKKLYPQYHQYQLISELVDNGSIAKENISQSSTHEERRIGDIENDIRSCKELKVLETYRFIAKSKPEFQAAYDEVYAKLSNRTK